MLSYGKSLTVLLAILGFAAFFAGCSHPEESGFLGNYSGFKETGLIHKNLEYVNKDVDFSQYRAVKILPVQAYLINKGPDVSRAEVEVITGYFQKQLREQFTVYFPETYNAGPGVVVVKAAITSLIPTNVAENAAAQGAGFIPGVGIIVGAGEAAYKGVTHDTLGMGQASMEVEFLDGETGQRLFGFVAKKDGSTLDIKGQATRWGVVYTIEHNWAAFLAAKLKKLTDPSFDESTLKKIEQQL